MSKNRDLANYGTAALEDASVSATGDSVVKRDASGNVSAVDVYASGNVGVGVASPAYKLDVAGTVNVVSGANGRINIGATNNYLYGDSVGNFIVGTSGSDKLTINSSGNVGIGTSSPSAKLSLGTGTGKKFLAYDSGATGIQSGIGVDLSGSSFDLSLFSGYNGGNGIITFGGLNTGNNVYTERMRIDSSGNVGIGTSSPNAKLHVGGAIVSDNFTNGRVVLDGTDASLNYLYSATTGFSAYRNLNISANDIILSTPTERARLTSDGYLRMSANSGGIQFNGDTSASNALDDYEEGTWAPTLLNGGSIVVGGGSAVYIKIGNQVTVSAYVVFSDLPNNGSIFYIGGMPFAASNLSVYPYGAGSISYSAGAISTDIGGPLIFPGSSEIYFHFLSGSSAAPTNSDLIGRSLNQLIFTFTYFVV